MKLLKVLSSSCQAYNLPLAGLNHADLTQAIVEFGNHTVALGPALFHRIRNETERQDIAKGPSVPAILKLPEAGVPHASQLDLNNAPAASKTPEEGGVFLRQTHLPCYCTG